MPPDDDPLDALRRKYGGAVANADPLDALRAKYGGSTDAPLSDTERSALSRFSSGGTPVETMPVEKPDPWRDPGLRSTYEEYRRQTWAEDELRRNTPLAESKGMRRAMGADIPENGSFLDRGTLDASKVEAYAAERQKAKEDALPSALALLAHGGRTVASGVTLGYWKGGLRPEEDELVDANKAVRGPAGSAVGSAGVVLSAAMPGGPVSAITKGVRGLGVGARVAPALGFGLATGLEHKDVGSGLEAAVFVGAAGPIGRFLKGKDPGFIRRVAGEAAAVLGVGSGMSAAKGEEIDWASQGAQAALFGVLSGLHASPLTTRQENMAAREADIARKEARRNGREPTKPSALNPEGIGIDPTRKTIAVDPKVELNPDRIGVRPTERRIAPPMPAEKAAAVVKEAVETGKLTPTEAFSPERIAVAEKAVAEGKDPVAALEATPTVVRPDGSVAGPAGQPIETAKIDPAVRPLVEDMTARGIETVTSGKGEDGRPFAAGVAPDGKTVVERGTPKPPNLDAMERKATGKSLSQVVRDAGGFDYQREYHKGELDMLRQKDSGSSGLVKTKAKGGKTAEELIQVARDEGFDIPEGMSAADFIDRVIRDVESGKRDISPQTSDFEALADVSYRRAMNEESARIEAMRAEATSGSPSSIKNEAIRLDRERRGLPPIEKGPARPWDKVAEEAKKAVEDNPELPNEILRKIDRGEALTSDRDVQVLIDHRVRLDEAARKYDAEGAAARAAGDMDAALAAKENADRVEAEKAKSDFLYDAAGGDSARALAARAIEKAYDYSIVSIERKMRRAKDYEPLSEAERAKAKELADRVTEAVRERDEYKARAEKAEAALAKSPSADSRKAPPAEPGYGSRNKVFTREMYEAAKKSLREKMARTNVGIDPTALKEIVIMAGHHVESIGREFAAWAKGMKDEFGDGVGPYLQSAWETANKRVDEVSASQANAKIKAAELSLAEHKRRVATGDVFPKPKEKGETSPELEAIRRQRDELLDIEADMRKAATPKRSENDKLIKRLQRTLSRLENQLATGDVATKPRAERPARDVRAIALEAKVLMARKAVNEVLFQQTLAARSKAAKAGAAIFEANTTARALMTSFDFSAVLRQGGIEMLSHPIRTAKALPDMFRAFASKDAAARSEAEITMRPTYGAMKRAGLFLSEHGNVSMTKMEEAYQSRWAEKIPGVAGSQRAYTTFLNRVRADAFDAMTKNLSVNGTPTLAEAKAVANYINVATGRGGGSRIDKAAVALNQVFFSPRLMASRFQYIIGQPMYGGSARTRKLIATEYARFIVGASFVGALGAMVGGKIDGNDDSPDFAKLRFGDTRVDFLSGLGQMTRIVANNAEALGSVATGGKPDDRIGDRNTRFFRTKFAPIVAAYADVSTGENVVGDKVKPSAALGNLVTPITFQGKKDDGGYVFFEGGDLYDIWREQGIPAATAAGMLNLFGMSVSHYQSKKKKPTR